MRVDLDNDESHEPERITDPIIKRYAHRLHMMTWELITETEHYDLNPEQIQQFIDSLRTLRAVLIFAEDLERLDAMLRLSFPGDYYGENESVIPMLTDYPLSTSN